MEKPVFIKRAENRSFSVIANACLRDPKLSARCKGIYAYLMTLPDDWVLYRQELDKHFREGRDALNTGFMELMHAGYVTRRPRRTAARFDGWIYTIHEETVNTDSLKTRQTVIQGDGESVTTENLLKVNIYSIEYGEKGASRSGSALPFSSADGGEYPEAADSQGEGLFIAGGETGTPKKPGKPEKTARKGAGTPKGAPWSGVDYMQACIPGIESYDDLQGITDPIRAAIAVTGERSRRGFGHWIDLLNYACADGMPLDMALRLFFNNLEILFGEMKAGEIQKPGAALTRKLQETYAYKGEKQNER